MAIDTCRHCGYGIPSDSSICPGCARRHIPEEAAFARLAVAPQHRSPMLRSAQRTRRSILLAGWIAVAFGIGALAHVVVHLDRVSAEISGRTPERVTDATEGLATTTLVALGLVLALTAVWARRAQHNMRALGITHGFWSAWSLGGWPRPGRAARERRQAVDDQWRDTSPILSALPHSGRTRRPVSQVVVRWWVLWAWLPAVAVLVVVVGGAGLDHREGSELGLAGAAAAGLLVASLRSLYDVVGIVTLAHAHRISRDRRPPNSRWVDESLNPDVASSRTAGTAKAVP